MTPSSTTRRTMFIAAWPHSQPCGLIESRAHCADHLLKSSGRRNLPPFKPSVLFDVATGDFRDVTEEDFAADIQFGSPAAAATGKGAEAAPGSELSAAELQGLRALLTDPAARGRLVQEALVNPAVAAYAPGGGLPDEDKAKLREYDLGEDVLDRLIENEILASSYPDVYGEQAAKHLLKPYDLDVLKARVPYPAGFPRDMSRCPKAVWEAFSKRDQSNWNAANAGIRDKNAIYRNVIFVAAALCQQETGEIDDDFWREVEQLRDQQRSTY
eukprot:COSAG05_NODE_140_length_16665_cov_48.470059_12_plen_271_part_00